MQRNVMNGFGRGTCAEQGYTCDIQPRFISNIKREVNPNTGAIISQVQECQAFYQCRHCQRIIPVGTKTANIDEVVTFDTMLQERRDKDAVEYEQKKRSGR